MTRGNALDEKGDFDRAIADYNEAHPAVAELRRRVFQSRARRSAARATSSRRIADYDQAIRLDPKNASAFNNRGIVWFEKGDLDRAVADYNLALRLDPGFAAGLQQPRRCLARQKRSDARSRRISITPSSYRRNLALAYDNRGLVYYQKRDFDHAIADFDAAIRFDPTSAEAYSNRGNAHDDKGDRNAAIADYNEAIRLDPNNARIYYNRGIAYRRDGDLDRAIADFERGDQAQSAACQRLQRARLRLLSKARFRARHRRLRSGDQAQSAICRRFQQSRQCLRRQGRRRPRHRRLQ